jgi:hypothetical protein
MRAFSFSKPIVTAIVLSLFLSISPLLALSLTKSPRPALTYGEPLWKEEETKSRMANVTECCIDDASLESVDYGGGIESEHYWRSDASYSSRRGRGGPYCATMYALTGGVTSIIKPVFEHLVYIKRMVETNRLRWLHPKFAENGLDIKGRFSTDIVNINRLLDCVGPVHLRELKWPRIWAQPSTIGPSGSILSVLELQQDQDEANNGRASGGTSYVYKPTGYPDLPFPEAPLFGIVAVLFGGWLAQRGIRIGPLSALIGGWSLMVFGGMLIMLFTLPYIADEIRYPLGLHRW